MLATLPPNSAHTIVDHIEALKRYSRHDVYRFPHVGIMSNRLPPGLHLHAFDVLVIHYSLYTLNDVHLSEATKQLISEFRGLKVLFLQDEYRQIDHMIANILRLRINVLFTCVPEQEIEKVYPRDRLPDLVKVSNLTGYVPEALCERAVPPIARRPIDVGYRSRVVPFWLGKLGAEKWQIVPKFEAATRGSGLVCDLSFREEDRVYAREWVRFVTRCKAMLGVESGASVFDFSGDIQRMVEAHLSRNPRASFEEVHLLFLQQAEDRIRLNQISPRCFEAAALRTTMVLYEGEYSGILSPWRHFIPLKKDFSNIEEVVAALRDPVLLQRIADCAYEEVALNPSYSYARFVAGFDAVIDSAVKGRGFKPENPIGRVGFALIALPAGVFSYLLRGWLAIPPKLREKIKPVFLPIVRAIKG